VGVLLRGRVTSVGVLLLGNISGKLGSGSVEVREGSSVADSVLSPCGVSKAVAYKLRFAQITQELEESRLTSSPSSPNTSPTTSPSSLVTHVSAPSAGPYCTSPLSLSEPVPNAGGCGPGDLIGEGMGDADLGRCCGTSTSRRTRGNGDVGGKSSARARSKALVGVTGGRSETSLLKVDTVGVETSPRSTELESRVYPSASP
jgi:hypothetical protein